MKNNRVHKKLQQLHLNEVLQRVIRKDCPD